jgi:hypothetical protein
MSELSQLKTSIQIEKAGVKKKKRRTFVLLRSTKANTNTLTSRECPYVSSLVSFSLSSLPALLDK